SDTGRRFPRVASAAPRSGRGDVQRRRRSFEFPFWRLKCVTVWAVPCDRNGREATGRPGRGAGTRTSPKRLTARGARLAPENKRQVARVVHIREGGGAPVGAGPPRTPPQHPAFELIEAPRQTINVLRRSGLDVHVHPARGQFERPDVDVPPDE